jgi:hypothetical protein
MVSKRFSLHGNTYQMYSIPNINREVPARCLHASKDPQLPIKAHIGMRGYLRTAERCLKVYVSLPTAELS